MSVYDDFIRAIRERPSDDTVRLVYADYLEENGQETRAEFIRLQIQLAQHDTAHPQYPEWLAREKELAQQHAWEWAAPFAPYVSAWHYQRGFIDKIQLAFDLPADTLRGLLRLAPIQSIRQVQPVADLASLVEILPDLQQLRGLELWRIDGFDPGQFRELLFSPHLAQLRTLILHHDQHAPLLPEALVLEAILSPYRKSLRQLGVQFDGVWRGPSDAILRGMATSPHLGKMRRLWLSHSTLDSDVWEGLTRAMPKLSHLDLHSCEAPLPVWNRIVRSAKQDRLQWLRVSDARVIGPERNEIRDLYEVARLRQTLRQASTQVDWWSEFIDPWHGGRWQGYTWEGYRQQHLFGMARDLEERDWERMEERYRRDCFYWAGEGRCAEVESVPMESGLNTFAELWPQFVNQPRSQSVRSIYLMLEPWGPVRLVTTSDDPGEQWAAYESQYLPRELSSWDAGDFEELWEMYAEQEPLRTTDPGAVRHYLIARLLAELHRIVVETHPRIPICAQVSSTVFRLE